MILVQASGACVEQIPPGARPPAVSAPVLKVVPSGKPVVAAQPPPGVYVQVANSATQEEAVKAGLDLSQRLGRDRPAFIRGLSSTVEGERRMLLFAGPFADAGAVRRFCTVALPNSACQVRVFAPETGNGGPDPRRAREVRETGR